VTPESWLIALDIDGTLLEFGEPISQPVLDTVRAAVEAGHHIVLASGRSLISMEPVFNSLGITATYMVCSNGAITVRSVVCVEVGNPSDRSQRKLPTSAMWEVAEAITFDPEPALRRLAEHLPGAIFAVEDVGTGFRMTDLFPPGELDGVHRVVPLEDLWRQEVVRVVVRAVGLPESDFHQAIAELGLADVTYAIGWSSWMDVSPLGVTKASALEKVRQRLGIPSERTMAIGDGSNDVDMLRWAARGVAMGNAPAEVKVAASEVTATQANDGVAQTLLTLPRIREIVNLGAK